MLAERKTERKQGRLGERKKVDLKERDGQRENGQTLVTRGTILGIMPIGTAKRVVLRWMRGLLLNHLSVQ